MDAGSSGTLNLSFSQGDLLSVLGGGFTGVLEVSDGAGGWVGIDQASGGTGLLDLLGLFGSGTTAQIDGLAAGEYRFTLSLDPNLVAVGASATASLSVDNASLTDFIVEPGADVEGNVITDPGFNGQPDSTGALGDATVQVEVGGVFVDADATVGTVLQGQYGELTIFANGDYSYTPNGDVASIGQVDSFAYQLVTAAGGVASANLYIRIDSNDTTIVWSPTDPAAPGVVDVVATDDIGAAQVDIDNLVETQSLTELSYSPPVIGSTTDTSESFVVAVDTTAELEISRSFVGIGVLPTTTINLQKLIDGVWTTQQTTTTAAHTFTGLDAGEYRVTSTTGALVSAGTVTVDLTLSTTHLTEFVTGAAVAATGNVLELSDLSPADSLGSTLTVLSVLVNGLYVIPGQAGAQVQGLYGTLTLQADGSYSYTPTPGLALADIGQVDTFTYKLTTPAGQEDTANLYIRIDSPDRDLVWDDANPGSPATEGAGFAAASIMVDEAASGDDSAGTEGSADSGSDDPVVVDGTDFTHVDGGAGAEGWLWEGGDAAINLSDLIGTASGVQSIDLNDVSAVELTLSLEDLVSITGPESDRLMIQGDDQDSVHLTGDWSAGATQVENGLEYVIYTSQEDETHQLWIQSGISVV
ncbi:BapA/Bap/LapF family large adhesin [Pseudomonas shahriarae]|uniref:BapA/Bap/LapF family large adhesin n=1 Tax=Pseudomonas TaxID=286 RepID=UPI001F093F88|nr:VCBS domain-containing protein [Pseudomonas shahriarae]